MSSKWQSGTERKRAEIRTGIRGTELKMEREFECKGTGSERWWIKHSEQKNLMTGR